MPEGILYIARGINFRSGVWQAVETADAERGWQRAILG
jgi:hypothetical protein